MTIYCTQICLFFSYIRKHQIFAGEKLAINSNFNNNDNNIINDNMNNLYSNAIVNCIAWKLIDIKCSKLLLLYIRIYNI